MNFSEKIKSIISKNQSLLCIGLDPLVEKIPVRFKNSPAPLFEFNKYIIDQTFDLICAYKPQIAYYSAQNAEDQLIETIHYLQKNFPHIPVILDSKRGDIGETSKQYAIEAFQKYKADAVTVNPYMGHDSLSPFFDYQDKGIIILCKTSNEGSSDFQNLEVNGNPLYMEVAKKCLSKWNKNKNILLVVGATHPQEMKKLRDLSPETFFLVPGIGAQGGNLVDVLSSGLNQEKSGLIISSSRSIIYSESPKESALKIVNEIKSHIKN